MTSFLSSADRALAQRIEAADSAMTSHLFPQTERYASEAIAGGYCLYGGAGSPMTHAMGVGMTAPSGAAELDAIEAFYRARGVACTIDLCPLARDEFQQLLFGRGYRAVEFNNVMVRRIEPGVPLAKPEGARLAGPGEIRDWARVVATGFAEGAEPPPGDLLDTISACGLAARCYFGEVEGRAAAGGALGMQDGVGWMFGDATLPAARGRGLQQALILARLADSAAHGCDLAGAAVVPGTSSHRNYERLGFRLLYMRVSLTRDVHAEVRP